MAPRSIDSQMLVNGPTLSCESQNGECGETTPSRLLKRQRSSDKMHEKRKKSRQDSAAGSTPSCPLLVALREYGLLENVLSCLYPDDLLALLLCSKSIYQTLVPQPGSLENLLGKLRCSGKGVQIRRERHVKSSFFYAYECSEYVECGAIDGVAESRPCTNCKVTTCNECRIHCVYQSIFEKPCEDDELPNYSGFILLSPSEIPILSPHHLKDDLTTPQWQAPSPATTAPYHDQGFIDVPLEEESFGPPECVDDFLNLDLGTCTFAGPVASNVAHPSPVLRSLYQTTEGRKRRFCDNHLPSGIPKQRTDLSIHQCQCSLRSRFLDRWLCLRCYENEETTLRDTYVDHVAQCCCGSTHVREICMWCLGEISQPHTEEAQSDSQNSLDERSA
ncbi:hypothetical protein COCVIDRAFT_21548 [Bipolaris victoriae FI3]|uniref:Uncharacterized protein n=1 Tax=Bipolaris victoriae (strain FI3) TaxID=930091 RepID=W7F1N6_BIPV3|nr:hypothetical protein COCVIDRAFT_21548 [Bipolaris victoriae FI3]